MNEDLENKSMLMENKSDKPEDSSGNMKVMGFLDHLEELRWVLIKSAAIFVIAVAIVAFFMKDFSAILNWPLKSSLGDRSGLVDGLVTHSPLAVFSVLVQIGFLGALGLSLPFMLYFSADFIAPALTKKERTVLLPTCIASLSLFLLGASFSYFVLVPGVISFSLSLNEMLGFELIWAADRYYNMLVWMILGIGLCFEFPLIVCILVYLGVLRTETLRAQRRLMIVLFFVAGMIITPTWDPMTQTLVAVPMWILYEISIIIGVRMERKRNADLDEALKNDDFYQDDYSD